VSIADEQRRVRLPAAKLRRIARAVLAGEGARLDLSLAFVTDRAIRALNRRFLRHDRATDVLAFRLDDAFGEVVVSTDTAAREAKARGIGVEEELLRYVAHGVLHLLGYDDHTPPQRGRMWRRQERYVRLESGPSGPSGRSGGRR
jgi:probable rRNA maturation factor